jgi:hypothetical protein
MCKDVHSMGVEQQPARDALGSDMRKHKEGLVW